MGADVVTREQMKHSLDDWYRVMLQQNIEKATEMKEEIESKISGLDVDQEVLLYHALLNFRYDALVDWISVREDSFDKVESFEIPTEGFLAYYYHFFKGFHCTLISNYNEAKEQYEQAEKLLKYIADPIEHAEFNYRMGYFYYQVYQQMLALDYIKKAKEIFCEHKGYEGNVALCHNFIGLCCIDFKQFELAEESLNTAIHLLQQHDKEEKHILMVRSNLGWLYSSQNLSDLAIRHLSEVTKKMPKHFKAIFTEAEENYKLGKIEIANNLIELGLKICNELQNKEFQHRFMILKELNINSSANELEKVTVESISYFEEHSLLDCVKEYAEILAYKFYQEEKHEKASKYFYISSQARKKLLKEGALK
ncbi:response regulator aspartate phosphatase [Bacillus cereus]